jgi:hypothetical protein
MDGDRCRTLCLREYACPGDDAADDSAICQEELFWLSDITCESICRQSYWRYVTRFAITGCPDPVGR